MIKKCFLINKTSKHSTTDHIAINRQLITYKRHKKALSLFSDRAFIRKLKTNS